MLGRCPVGLPDLGCANTGPEGPADSQGSAPYLGTEDKYIEKLEGAAAAGFINQYGCPSLGEVGLNIVHRRWQRTTISTDWWLQPILKGGSLVPVRGTNRY